MNDVSIEAVDDYITSVCLHRPPNNFSIRRSSCRWRTPTRSSQSRAAESSSYGRRENTFAPGLISPPTASRTSLTSTATLCGCSQHHFQ